MNPFTTLLKNYRARRPAGTTGAANLPTFDKVKAGLMLLTIAALSFMMSIHLRQDRLPLHLNAVSTREVRAARSVVYFDSEKTAELQKVAAQTVRPVYNIDDHAAILAHRTVDELFDSLDVTRRSLAQHTSLHTASARAEAIKQTLPAMQSASALSPVFLRRLLTVSPTVFQRLRDTSLRLVDEAMDREIRDRSVDLDRAQKEVQHRAKEVLPATEDASIVSAIVSQALRPNHLYAKAKTEAARLAAMRSVPSSYGRLFPGDKIISPDEVVHQDTLDKLTALGLLDPRQELTAGVAICVLAAVMVLVVTYYIAHLLPLLYGDTRRLALLAAIVLFSVAGLKVGATLLGLQFAGWQLGYLGMMSVTAAGMLVSVFLDAHLAMLIVALLSIQSGIIMNHEIRFSVMTLLSSLVGIATVSPVRRKTNLLQTTTALALSNIGLVWLLGMLFNDRPSELLTGSAWAVGVAPFATFLFWFGVLALEKPFGILTHTTLLEMSAFDRPLLKQLCAVAPGTYAHSMMVGTLAESGAQAVGADALLCRVGGYYHDIGKMNRPDFFIENQRNDNVHGRLSPSLSALIITAHVRDGIDMAKEHRLPVEIRDIIAQHHGTTLISYFYRQALADNTGGDCTPPGLEERFRYPGPRPQTREAAIVMLADSVEAAARCIEKPDQEKLEALIVGIVRGKIEDGQLDECTLTFADVKKISDAFQHVLRAMMHGRIDYPKDLPRTASGIPMEVMRADLKPTAPSIQLPLPPDAVSAATGTPLCTVIGRSLPNDPENSPSSAVISSISAINPRNHSDSMDTVGEEKRQGLPILDAADPEDMYDRQFTERPVPSGADNPIASGSPAPAAGGRPRPRGSKRSADR